MIWLLDFLRVMQEETEIILHTGKARTIACTAGDALEWFRGDMLRNTRVLRLKACEEYDAIEFWTASTEDDDEAD